MRILNHKKNKIMRKIPFEYRRSVFFWKKNVWNYLRFQTQKKNFEPRKRVVFNIESIFVCIILQKATFAGFYCHLTVVKSIKSGRFIFAFFKLTVVEWALLCLFWTGHWWSVESECAPKQYTHCFEDTHCKYLISPY